MSIEHADRSLITLGLWPIAGITTVGVTQSDARQTIQAAIECGIDRFDTAFSYGYEGECDRLLGELIKNCRDQFHVTAKVGQRWGSDKQRVIDGSPEMLTRDAETSLKRLQIERFDTLLLHCPDPNVPIESSAEAMESLRRRGLAKQIGVGNVSVKQRQRFAKVAECRVIQCPMNLLQHECLDELVPDCQAHDCDVFVFWTLMKGLLSGKITRDHVFADGDVRPSYPIFQNPALERTHRVIDGLRLLGKEIDRTVAQLAIGWVISQPGITGALVGARRPDQIRETVMATKLPADVIHAIDQIVLRVDDSSEPTHS